MIKLNKTIGRHCGRMLGVLALLFGFCIPTWAEVYPGRPVTLVVPFPPGGVADTVGLEWLRSPAPNPKGQGAGTLGRGPTHGIARCAQSKKPRCEYSI